MRETLEYLEVLELNGSINDADGESRSSSNLPKQKKNRNLLMNLDLNFYRVEEGNRKRTKARVLVPE